MIRICLMVEKFQKNKHHKVTLSFIVAEICQIDVKCFYNKHDEVTLLITVIIIIMVILRAISPEST